MSLEGKKTIIGIATTFIGYLGLATVITGDQVGTLIDLLVQLIGLGVTIYGAWDKQRRLNDALNK